MHIYIYIYIYASDTLSLTFFTGKEYVQQDFVQTLNVFHTPTVDKYGRSLHLPADMQVLFFFLCFSFVFALLKKGTHKKLFFPVLFNAIKTPTGDNKH